MPTTGSETREVGSSRQARLLLQNLDRRHPSLFRCGFRKNDPIDLLLDLPELSLLPPPSRPPVPSDPHGNSLESLIIGYWLVTSILIAIEKNI